MDTSATVAGAAAFFRVGDAITGPDGSPCTDTRITDTGFECRRNEVIALSPPPRLAPPKSPRLNRAQRRARKTGR